MPDPRIWPIPSVTDTYATVLGVSTLVLAANVNRVGADFVNDSVDVIYLARGNDAVVGSGIRLNANGGSYSIGTDNLFEGAVYGISDGGEQNESNLTVSEGYMP